MKGSKTLAVMLGAALLMFTACSKEKTTQTKDTEGPVFSVDTMRAGATVLADTAHVTSDSIILKGRATDASGVDKVTATLGSGTFIVVPNSSTGEWTLTLFLRSGVNTIALTAEDEEGNSTGLTRKLTYRTNYMPLDSASRWAFKRGNDTLSIKVDSAWRVSGVHFRFFKVSVNNQDDDALDTLMFAQDSASGNVKASDTGWFEATQAPVMLLKEYTPTTASYGSFTVTFIGDTIFNTVAYRNVVKLTYVNPSDWLVYISSYYLAPSLGFVHINTRTDLPFNRIP